MFVSLFRLFNVQSLQHFCFQSLLLLVFLGAAERGLSQESENSGTENSYTQRSDDYRKAAVTFAQLDQSGNFTESLSYADMNVLPMGMKQTFNNTEVTIAVSNMRWETSYTALTVFARVKIPQEEGKPLFFGAHDIKLSHEGNIIGDASLVLLGDVTIPINGSTAALVLKGSIDTNTGRATEMTFVSIDCFGFKEMGISAEVEFSESLLKPVDGKGSKMPGRVIGAFKTIVKDWNDIVADISLPPFEIVGLKGFTFTIQRAVFDYSDFRNAPNITYPENYEFNYMVPGNPALWRGVFVEDLLVTLPVHFKKRGTTERVSFSGHKMLLDNNGISGSFTAARLIPIEEGQASGWRFSVEDFNLKLEANQLTAAGFSGQIGLPVAEKSALRYKATISADDEYTLRVEPMGEVAFDVFHAKAELLPNSFVELKVVDGEFKPEALLHGSLNLAARLDGATAQDTTSKPIAQFKGIEFRSLRLKTDAPRFTAEYFGYKGSLQMMNFPVSITRIGLRANGDEVALGMDVALTLSDNLFTGSTRLELIGGLREESGAGEGAKMQQWKYQKLKVSSVAVDATVAEVFTVKGGLIILDNDPVYGDGFAGNIVLTFDKVLKGAKISTRAIFGRKDFRYWFVDGTVSFPGEGLQVFPPLSLSGFGGGIAYRMKRDGAYLQGSPTGTRYVPDENSGLGVKAAVMFNVGSSAAANGEASFEVMFSPSGGVNFMGFYGYAKFAGQIPGMDKMEGFVKDKFNQINAKEMEFLGRTPGMEKTLTNLKQYEPDKVAQHTFVPSEEPGKAGFGAAVGIQYDFTQRALHATFDLYVNAVGGLVRGTASGNRAGWAVLHIDPQDWYVHMGTPTDKLGLKMGIGNIINVETGSYLMLGSQIPGSPPPPKEVADILGVELDKLDYMRDLNALGDGRGFAFGSSLRVATGDISFLMLYANFQAGLGFDVMLKDYADAQCKGRSGKIGFDGWYANGQAYAFLQGELGVKVNLWFIKAKVPIIKGAAAALLQAQLPNPVWFKGYMGVKFNVLGGLVSGNCRFKFTIGEECELVIPGGSPLDIRMIGDVVPKNKADNVDVFTAPQVAFNMRVNVPFDIEDDHGFKSYRIHLNEFTVLDDGKALEGKLVWNPQNDGVSFYSHEVLPPNKTLKAIVSVGFEQWQSGKWITVYTAGVKAQEIMEVSFETGTAPEVIPLHNIDFSYPVVDQRFFLKDESPNGFIQLKRGQSYLFSTDYKHEVQISHSDGTRHAASFSYSSSTNRIDYSLPALQVSQPYSIRLASMNKDGSDIVAKAVQVENIGYGENEITVTNNAAGTVLRDDVGKSLLEYTFVTSRYGTFAQKIQSIQKGSAAAGRIASDVINLQYDVKEGEPFSLAELRGTAFTGHRPLVAATALLNDDYYKEDIYPVLYKNYPLPGITLERDPALLGIPPDKAIALSTAYLTEVEQNNFNGLVRHRFPYLYNLPKAYKDDFVELQHKIVNRFLGTSEQAHYNYIMNAYYRFIRPGYYPVNFQYILPDGTAGTSAVFDYYNFIN